MVALNIGFGLIGVLSFWFAIWSYYKMKKEDELKKISVSEIRKLAYRIKSEGNGTVYEGLAEGVISFCNTLLLDKLGIQTGDFKMKLYPYESPMVTKIGEEVNDPGAIHGRALTATAQKLPNIKLNHLVYGPYYKLPHLGAYEVRYNIKLIPLQQDYDTTQPLIRIDVYNPSGKTILAKKDLCMSDFPPNEYNEFFLRFNYHDLNNVLEYRIQLLKIGVSAFTDLITLKKL